MMDFLRALAPRRDGDSSWAAPVMPSRFSGVRPINVEPSAPEATTVIPAAPHDFERSEARTTSPARGGDRAASVAPRVTPLVQPAVLQGDPAREIHHHHHEPRVVEAVTTPVVTPASSQRIVTRVSTPRPVEPASILRADVAPAIESRPSRAIAQQRPLLQTVRVHAPLSPAAVAERKGAPATERPVIHVTIDRIDVRAPGTTRSTARTSRGRATSPSVSLADYLRGPRTGGGAL